MNLKPREIFGSIERELAEVERELYRAVESELRVLFVAFSHTVGAGGKRIRPALVLLCGKIPRGECSREIIEVSASFEIIHLASLIHDDVIDHSPQRRGKETINVRWGDGVSILLGDYLFAVTVARLSGCAGPEVLEIALKSVARMCEAELNQLENRNNLNLSESEYLQMVEGKTAALFSACCQAGALMAGAELEIASILSSFGLKLGVAFQLVDDVLDFTGERLVTGKALGNDLREGKVTLPLIYARSRWDGRADELLKDVMGNSRVEGERLRAAVDLVKEAGGAEYARRRAWQFAEEAKAELKVLPFTAGIDALEKVADFVVNRNV